MAKAVFGLVDTESQAERIVDNLKVAGFATTTSQFFSPIKAEPGILPMKKPPRRLKALRQAPAQVLSSAAYWDGSSA